MHKLMNIQQRKTASQNNLDALHFFTVSKKCNIPYIHATLNYLRRNYNIISYAIIVPGSEKELFERSLLAHSEITKIIDEARYISYTDFVKIGSQIVESSGQSLVSDKSKWGWYYQQVLKLAYLFENTQSERIVMFDADTVLTKKIRFFNRNKSISYHSPYEKEERYRMTCETILKRQISKYWKSSIVQFISMNSEELENLQECLNKYTPQGLLSTSEWLSFVLFSSIAETHNVLGDNNFSEMELIGFLKGNPWREGPHKYLYFIRSTANELSPVQLKLLPFLGIAHVTYEQWLLKTSQSKPCSWPCFIKAILKAYKPLINDTIESLSTLVKL